MDQRPKCKINYKGLRRTIEQPLIFKRFLNITPKEWAKKRKEKFNNLTFIKIKTCCASNDTPKKMEKKRHREWKQILLNHTSDENLVSRIYRETIQLNDKPKKKKTDNLENEQITEWTLIQGTCVDGQSAHEKMLNILFITEIQIKTTMI